MSRRVWFIGGGLITALLFAMVCTSPQSTQARTDPATATPADTATAGPTPTSTPTASPTPTNTPAIPSPTSPPPTWTPGTPPEKTPVPTSPPTEVDPEPTGVITLQVLCADDELTCEDRLATLWTQVEVQNADGSWEPITAWVGPLTQIEATQGRLSWWFGSNVLPPVRWTVAEGDARTLLVVSNVVQPEPETATVITVAIPNALLPTEPVGTESVLLPASGRSIAIAAAAVVVLVVSFLTTRTTRNNKRA